MYTPAMISVIRTTAMALAMAIPATSPPERDCERVARMVGHVSLLGRVR